MKGFKIVTVSKGSVDKDSEYHITFDSNGLRYKSSVRINKNGIDMRELSFGEVQTISLDHYRLDEFEKIFILNYQKITDDELKTDPNFKLVYQYIINTNSTLKNADLIGADRKSVV